MFIQPLCRRFSTALAVTSFLLPATPPKGQTPNATPDRIQTEIVQIRAENAAIRKELRKLEDSQRMLLQQVQRLQRACDGSSTSPNLRATNDKHAARTL
jgi:hypothetical protein